MNEGGNTVTEQVHAAIKAMLDQGADIKHLVATTSGGNYTEGELCTPWGKIQVVIDPFVQPGTWYIVDANLIYPFDDVH